MTEAAESPTPPSSADAAALHAPTSVGLAALVGTPLAGGLLFSANDEVLGQTARGTRVLVASCLLSAGVAAAWMILRERLPWMVIPPVSGVLMYLLASRLQGAAFEAHVKGKGAVRSPAAALGAGAMTLALMGGGVHLFGTILFSGPSGNVMIRPQQLVYFDDGAQKADAQRVGDALTRIPYPGDPTPFFSGDHPSDVKVLRPKGRWTLQFVLRPGAWNDPKIRTGYEQLAAVLRDELFPGQPMDLHLADDGWNPRHRFTVP